MLKLPHGLMCGGIFEVFVKIIYVVHSFEIVVHMLVHMLPGHGIHFANDPALVPYFDFFISIRL